MAANTVKTWLKRYLLWILLALAAGLFILSKLLPTLKRRPELFYQAREKARELRDKAIEDVADLTEDMRARREELDKIKRIADPRMRMVRLALFASRKKRSRKWDGR